jgi:glycosyltransferase involved in cell wall biosynthesis
MERPRAKLSRVLLMAGASSPGGLHQHVATLTRGLRRLGLEVHVVLPPNEGADSLASQCEAAGAAVSRVAVRGKWDLAGALAVRRLVTRERPDVIHVHLSSPVEGLPALLALRAGGAPRLVTTEHAPTWFPLRRTYSSIAKRLVGRGVAAVIAVSQADARFLEQEFGVLKERLYVVPNGVDLDGYDHDRRAARLTCGLPVDAGFLVGYLGALEPKKGIEDLLEAASASRINGLIVALAGEGSMAARLSQGAHPPCRLLGQLDDPKLFLASLDAFAFPSHQEALPLALLEAMAARLPVIATRVGGIPEAVEDGVSGLLVEPHRPDQLEAALQRIAEDRELALRLGAAARARVEREFSAQRMVRDTVAVYGRTTGCMTRT